MAKQNKTVLTTEDVARGGRKRWEGISKEERSRRMKLTRAGKKHTIVIPKKV